MLSSGFAHAAVTKNLIAALVLGSLVASITDTKHYFAIQAFPHLLKYRQLWRLGTWQLCYLNSTEVLFAVVTLYQLRTIERLWGSRKFAVMVRSVFSYAMLTA